MEPPLMEPLHVGCDFIFLQLAGNFIFEPHDYLSLLSVHQAVITLALQGTDMYVMI